MEASKFYELERLLEEFEHYIEPMKNEDDMVQVGRTLKIVEREISDIETITHDKRVEEAEQAERSYLEE